MLRHAISAWAAFVLLGCGGGGGGGGTSSAGASSASGTTSSASGTTSSASGTTSSSSGGMCGGGGPAKGSLSYTVGGVTKTLPMAIISAAVPTSDPGIGFVNGEAQCVEGVMLEIDDVIAPASTGTFDVAAPMRLGAVKGLGVTLDSYVAGFSTGIAGGTPCAPCGSGTVTVKSVDTGGSGSASGTFDVTGFLVGHDMNQAMTVDPTKTQHATGTWSMSFSCTNTPPQGILCD
jgi:hypothetical protein